MPKIACAQVLDELKKSILVDGFDMVLDLQKSKGAHLYDAKNKKTYLDFFSFFASNAIGFNHPKMHDADFERKLLEVARIKVSNSDIYTEPYAEFVSTFHQKTTPQFDRCFFIEGGALGVENAIKTAQDWKVRKNIKAGRGERGTQVLHFKEAFHGRTGYTMSLTNTAPEKVMYFPKFDWPRVLNPKRKFPETKENVAQTIKSEEESLSQINDAFAKRPHEICAIIVETIQGEGGDNFFRTEFLKKLRETADKNEALLIFDEVQCGLGITGKFWAWEHFGVQPDLMAFGKKVQVCGFAAKLDRLDEVDHVFKVSSRINSTWGGNLTDMVRANQMINIIIEEKLLDHVSKLGPQVLKELQGIAEKTSTISNVRGLGFWMAFDLPTTDLRNEFLEVAWDNGLIILPCGSQSIRIRPVLDMTERDFDEGLEIIKKSLKALKKHGGVCGSHQVTTE